MTKHTDINPPRGPSDHSVRDQVVEAATKHFGHFGYEKTTVSDLAKSIGFSKAYIYKFFDSKQAIGEVICSNRLAMIMAIVNSAIADAPSASEKLRRLFRALTEAGSDLFFTTVSSTTLLPLLRVISGPRQKSMRNVYESLLKKSFSKADKQVNLKENAA